MKPKPLTKSQKTALTAVAFAAKVTKEDSNNWAIVKLPSKATQSAWPTQGPCLVSTIRKLSKSLDGLVIEGKVVHMSKEVYDLGEAFRFDPETEGKVVMLAISIMIDNLLRGF
jgi:hypothetical protein